MGANYLKSKINENFVDSVNIGKKKSSKVWPKHGRNKHKYVCNQIMKN